MSEFLGTGVSRGKAIGTLFLFQKENTIAIKKDCEDPKSEFERFIKTRNYVISQYKNLQEKIEQQNEEMKRTAKSVSGNRKDNEAKILEIFESYISVLADPVLSDQIWNCCKAKRFNAEYAVETILTQWINQFAEMEDPYMRARSEDLLEIKDRLLEVFSMLKREDERTIETGKKQTGIMLADSLTPVDIAKIDRSKVRGIILQNGSPFSHTVIIAKLRNIPLVIYREQNLHQALGRNVLIDGESGKIILDYDEDAYNESAETVVETSSANDSFDHIKIFYSISSVEDVRTDLTSDIQGIGLYRTEIQYLKMGRLPVEEELFEEYYSVISQMMGRPVFIRTADLGGDKALPYDLENHENETDSEYRGVKFSLKYPEIFHNQLRAIYRASSEGNVSILFPMVTEISDIVACKEECLKVREELQFSGIPFDRDVPIGVMIETQESVDRINEIVKIVDFISIGTNDLTQAVLSQDRNDTAMDRHYDQHHAKVLRTIEQIAASGNSAGIPILLCGELAEDRNMIPFFEKNKITSLCVSASVAEHWIECKKR